MKKTTLLKVLVVYSSNIATSALSNKPESTDPFALAGARASYAQSYAYLLDTCKKHNLQAALTTSEDVVAPGMCKSFWTHDTQGWEKIKEPCFSTNIFDKFSPTDPRQKKKRELMFQNSRVKPFNDHELFMTFFDKFETYEKLAEFTIPTVVVKQRLKRGVTSATDELQTKITKSGRRDDFESSYVLKDRNGAGGNRVYKISNGGGKKIEKILRKYPKSLFVLQPMVAFDQGFEYEGRKVRADLRLILMGTKIVQTYVRIATPEEFRCNDHQGGSLHYLERSQIPMKVLKMAREIEKRLPPHDSLYALDFVISNGGRPYFLEGNTGPGLDWKPEIKMEEIKSKQLIRLIVKKLAERGRIDKNGRRERAEMAEKRSYLLD